MSTATNDNEVYIGDGVFASFDGYQVKLRAPRLFEDHEVYINSDNLARLYLFLQASFGEGDQQQKVSR